MRHFEYNARIERAYAADILGAVRRYFSAGWSAASSVMMGVPEWLETYAKQAAERMVTHQMVENAKDWREAARIAGRGPQIYNMLRAELRGPVGKRYRELVAENAFLIKTLPHKIAAQATHEMALRQQAGERAEFAVGTSFFGDLVKWQAVRVARTETAKANSALIQARSEQLGLAWYVWQTSRDGRVREAHRKMQGVLFRFDDPPSPEQLVGLKLVGYYNAGNIYNCRCSMEPLLRYLQVSWPHRVYWDDRIQYMTLARFREINSTNAALAA